MGQRILTQAITFDYSGKMTEAEFHPLPSALVEGLEERVERDALGNTIVVEYHDATSVARRELWTYAVDEQKNWTRQLVFLETTEDGKHQLEPVRTTYRAISYFTQHSTLKPDARLTPTATIEKEAVKPESPPAAATKSEEASVEARTPAKAIDLVKPVYPPYLRANRQGGAVVIGVLVDEHGKVDRAWVVSGPTLLHFAALSAARISRFEPTRQGQRAIPSETRITYNFIPEPTR